MALSGHCFEGIIKPLSPLVTCTSTMHDGLIGIVEPSINFFIPSVNEREQSFINYRANDDNVYRRDPISRQIFRYQALLREELDKTEEDAVDDEGDYDDVDSPETNLDSSNRAMDPVNKSLWQQVSDTRFFDRTTLITTRIYSSILLAMKILRTIPILFTNALRL